MTRLRNRSDSSKSGNSFSFILPFVIAFIVLILVIKYLFSPSTSSPTQVGSFMNVTPKQDQSEIYIYMSGDSKKRIESTTKMYVTDSKLAVTA